MPSTAGSTGDPLAARFAKKASTSLLDIKSTSSVSVLGRVSGTGFTVATGAATVVSVAYKGKVSSRKYADKMKARTEANRSRFRDIKNYLQF